jgi:aminoglycoside phosphotransferase
VSHRQSDYAEVEEQLAKLVELMIMHGDVCVYLYVMLVN